ncbi:MAG: hypothetical protein KGI52_11465 [Burkholderiales bacterium]|nr:hypothetical protein [Burkholderiales bacterium]
MMSAESILFFQFMHIARAWQLDEAEQIKLLNLTHEQWQRMTHDADLECLQDERARRINHLVCIHDYLNVIFSDPSIADLWVRQPNTEPRFLGATALDYMLSGPEQRLEWVASYVMGQGNCNFS